MLSTSKCDCT